MNAQRNALEMTAMYLEDIARKNPSAMNRAAAAEAEVALARFDNPEAFAPAQEKLVFPVLVSTGAVFEKSYGSARALNGDVLDIDVFAPAELWSNGTIFALVDGKQRRVNPATVDYLIKSA